jgi:hypothetical protein
MTRRRNRFMSIIRKVFPDRWLRRPSDVVHSAVLGAQLEHAVEDLLRVTRGVHERLLF